MSYANAKHQWAEWDRKEKSGEISKEQGQKEKDKITNFGSIQRDTIANIHGYGELAELLTNLSEKQMQDFIELIYGTAFPSLRDETGLMDIPNGQFIEMETFKNALINGDEQTRQLLTSLIGNILPEEVINNLGENKSTAIENVIIELPNVVDATTFAEEFNALVQEGFVNKPQN